MKNNTVPKSKKILRHREESSLIRRRGDLIKIASLTLAMTLFFGSFTKVNAQATQQGLTAIPPRLEINVKPDGVSSQTIKVRNESSQERTIKVSIEDFIVNDNEGTPTIVSSTKEDNRWAASNWIQVSPSSIRLKGGETKSLVLTVMPPKNALPGGHYAMVIHSPDDQVSVLNSTGAAIQTRVGTLVYITIDGKIKQNARITDFTAPKFLEYGPVDFEAVINNLSDVHINPIGHIAISNIFGQNVINLPLNDTNIFPYTSRTFLNKFDRKWLFGRYKANLQAGYGTAGGLLAATVFFWVIPWRIMILVATAAVLLFVLIKLVKQTNPPKKDSPKVEKLEEELSELKKKYKDSKN